MNLGFVVFILFASVATPASAATLYRWTDNSGSVRYGYHPPPGMNAVPAEDEQRHLYNGPVDALCSNLVKEHLRLIDSEMKRIESIPAGLGPEYEFTPAAKQELLLDLLAHRAALLSGRKASDFRSPSGQEMERLKEKYLEEKTRLQKALESKDEMIRVQQQRLERERRKRALPWRFYDVPHAIIVPRARKRD
ncbi:DUF4124 domain-containing protein [Methylocaldum szegediense]|uniref:DUF4124 domain-containing protein n=1 Tax=Methylocaldum szegediense TaxID=73780 RepID=A0ABM9I5I5_9GAMM|nr:DUF4124 domain-containing protein [Methylocaldum szegediense]CAI8904922.1 conserved exported protein of unknown function [Methylocaldum szegediense]